MQSNIQSLQILDTAGVKDHSCAEKTVAIFKKQLFFFSKILLSGHGSLGTFISCRLARMRCAAFNTRVVGGGSIFQYLRVWMGEGKQEDSSRQQEDSSPHSCPTAEVSCVPT
jgi:hypothetical protein